MQVSVTVWVDALDVEHGPAHARQPGTPSGQRERSTSRGASARGVQSGVGVGVARRDSAGALRRSSIGSAAATIAATTRIPIRYRT